MRTCSRHVADDDWARMCELAMRAPISHMVGSSFYKTKLSLDPAIVVDVEGDVLPVQFVRCEAVEGSESWMSCCVCCDRFFVVPLSHLGQTLVTSTSSCTDSSA